MNAQSAAPLVFFRVLAGRDGNPAALLFDCETGSASALAPLFDSADFAALSSEFPACYVEGIAPALAEALDAAGWQGIAPSALMRYDGPPLKEALASGAALVDGEWYMAPPPKASGPQAASRMLALQLVQLVAADAHTHEIEALLRKDPTLSYQLLRLVNSVGMSTGRRVTSFSQAILILGRQQLRRWLNLMVFAARDGDLRSGMLLARVAVRARLMEQIARQRGLDKNNQEQGFMSGMFSLLGVLFGMPLRELLAPLFMSEEVHAALLERGGETGAMLTMCEAAEQGDFDTVRAQLGLLQVAAHEFNEANATAARWMLGALRGSRGLDA